ncbi:TEL1 [Candida metapsilosis]|uniref:Serine/threonine-protein kinase Tel1 n=1 Tax=Candida metapsilosis TaxID=273372 RepID=A0A8H7ZHT3_9ASCO|nr:TEL1 [Candida metapsilosis]
MSALDVPQLATLLQSPKVKDKNDALSQLEIITASRWRLPSKQMRLLILAIFQLIEHEAQQFINSKSTIQASIASRLNKASYYLRLLVEKSISDKLPIKFKFYLEICFTIKSLFYVQDQPLGPCLIDFSILISSILRIDFVNDHLSSKDWLSVYGFLVTVADQSLQDISQTFGGINEKVLIEIWTALSNLLHCDTSSSCIHLFRDDAYFKVLPLMNKTVDAFKKEHPLHITIFKVLNKSIISLATTDFKFVNKLILLGIKMTLVCHKTRWEKLQDQFLIFLNLTTTHNFMCLDNLPKLIGDSDIQSSFVCEDSVETQISAADDPKIVYSMELLIIELLNYLLMLPSDLSESIGLCDPNNNVDWFNLGTIYFKGEDPRRWLYTTATVKLMKTYFDMKKSMSFLQESDRPSRGFVTDIIFNNLVGSYSIIDFCASLVSYRSTIKVHLLSLTLMSFYLELDVHLRPEPKAEQSEDSISASDKTNTTFDFTISAISEVSDLPGFLQSSIKTVEFEDGYFWLMLLARSILNKVNFAELNPRKRYDCLREILELALYGVNKPHGHLASDLIAQLVLRNRFKVNKIVDDAIITQLESVIDFPGVNGPSIHNEGFMLWYSMNKLCIDLNIKKKNILVRKIDEWLCEKWDAAFNSGMLFQCCLEEFIYWVSGLNAEFSCTIGSANANEGPFRMPMDLQIYQQALESFIVLRPRAVVKEEKTLQVTALITSESNCNFWGKIVSTFSKLNAEPIAHGNLFSWLITLSNLSLKMSYISGQQELWNTLDYQITVGVQAFSTFEMKADDVFKVIRLVVEYATENVNGSSGFISKVPFKKFLGSVVQSFQLPNRQMKRRLSDEDLEFSEVRESSVTPDSAATVTPSCQSYVYSPIFDLMKFKRLELCSSGNNEIETLSSLTIFVENFDIDNLLVALMFIVDEQLPKIHSIDSKQPLIKLLRILGERVLSNQELERNEMVLAIVSRVLSRLVPLLSNATEEDALHRDCFDIVQWLYTLGSKNYITTEVSLLDYMKFLITFLQHNNEMHISQTSLMEETFLKFSESTNLMKSKIIDLFFDFIQDCNPFKQEKVYSKLFDYFVIPQASVERAATYVYFFSMLAASSPTVLRMALFNFMECSKYSFFVPYLKLGFEELCLRCNFSSSRKLFETVKVDLLRKWWKVDSIKTFPFSLFNYDSLSMFLNENYREITAIIVSTKTQTELNFQTEDRSIELLSSIASVRNIDSEVLVSESLSLIFPLSCSDYGIGSRIFRLLMSYLINFKQEAKIQLPLIVLEIIKRLNMSDEVEVLRLLPRAKIVSQLIHQNSRVEINKSESAVSLRTGLELISQMVERYHTETSFFWSTPMIYFLIRRIGLSLHEELDSSAAILEIRRIKLVIVMGGENALSANIFSLLVKTLVPKLKNEILSPEVYRILGAFENVFQIGPELFDVFDTLSPLLNSLLIEPRHDVNDPLYRNFVNTLSNYARDIEDRGAVSPANKLIIAAIRQLEGEQFLLQISDIEEFLSDETSFNAISFVSRLFSSVVDPERLSTELLMLKHILALGNDQLSQLSEQFKLWISKCLSKYYYETPSFNLLDLLEMKEYETPSEIKTESHSSFFNIPMTKSVKYAQESKYDEAACAESVLGVYFNIEREDSASLQHVVNIEPIYTSMSGYIQNMKLKTCVLLNDEPNDAIADMSLSDLIDSFDSFFDLNPNNWCSKICLAFLKEIASFSAIGSVMSVFVVKVPSFALETIASFVCFYLDLVKARGEELVVALLNGFANLKHPKRESIKVFVGILLAVRIASKTTSNSSFASVYDKVDKLRYHELATECKMYKSALMIFEDVSSKMGEASLGTSHSSTLQAIYYGLDDIDIHYALPEKTNLDHLLNSKFRTGASDVQFQYSSGYLDASLKLDVPLLDGFSSMMSNAGMLGISSIVGKSMDQFVTDNDSYEWNWKLSKWDQPVPAEESNEHQSIYKVLKQIHDFPQNGESICRQSLLRLMDVHTIEAHMGIKDIQANFLTWLKSLASVTAIEDTINSTSLSNLDEKYPDFEKFENIILAKQTSFQILAEQPPSHTPSDSLWSLSLKELVLYNNLARIDGEQQKMVSSTVLIDKICNRLQNSQSTLHQNLLHLSRFQLAQSLWKQGITDVPVLILKELYNAGGVDIYDNELKVDKLMIKAMTIEWMSESRQELSSNLMENHVLPTAEMSLRLDDQVQQSRIFRLLAQFCETQYKSKSLSEQIELLEKRVGEKEKEIGELKSHYQSSQTTSDEKSSLNKFYTKLKSQYKAECADLEYSRSSKKQFVVKAIEYYLLTMSMSDFPEEDLDKFCALWLEQSNDDETNDKIERKLLLLPTHKLLSWSAQLISRLTKEETKFQYTLKKLIFQMCADHPYHTLYLLFSLKKHKQLAQKDANPLLVSKAIVAESLWEKLHDSSSVHKVVSSIQTFSEECIRLAEFKGLKGKSISLDKLGDFSPFWLHALPQIPPPTKSLKVDCTGSYSHIPVIWKIEKKISTASTGLSLPKIATLVLSDGSKHVMLMKHGTDDLRQDSIMEQVFGKVQNIFTRDKECSKRGLSIRTYNAVPLGPRSGVIEFVPNSTPFLDAIQPYHIKHDKMRIDKARDIMRQCQTRDKIERLHEYQRIEAKIKPVLNLFFQDCFLTPDRWFESRVKYTHGIATCSIVGYILGLGDRHCNNILLDKRNGEPIHIDLGVAFDQGKQLAIPETVPFRLTRDVVSGFGIPGVEGTFRISCQHTMRVLRENRDHIMSILDVLRWDPLYSWTVSPIRKKRLQKEEAKSGIQPEQDGSDAGRAVLAVSDKLIANGLSTEAVVRELIQEATSSQNLALLYFGWCPFY